MDTLSIFCQVRFAAVRMEVLQTLKDVEEEVLWKGWPDEIRVPIYRLVVRPPI